MYFCNGFQQRKGGVAGGAGREGVAERVEEDEEERKQVRAISVFLVYKGIFKNAAASAYYSPRRYSNYIPNQVTFLSSRTRTRIRVGAICLISIFGVLFHITARHLYATEVILSH